MGKNELVGNLNDIGSGVEIAQREEDMYTENARLRREHALLREALAVSAASERGISGNP